MLTASPALRSSKVMTLYSFPASVRISFDPSMLILLFLSMNIRRDVVLYTALLLNTYSELWGRSVYDICISKLAPCAIGCIGSIYTIPSSCTRQHSITWVLRLIASAGIDTAKYVWLSLL